MISAMRSALGRCASVNHSLDARFFLSLALSCCPWLALRRFDLYGGKRFVLADKRLALLFAGPKMDGLWLCVGLAGNFFAGFWQAICQIILDRRMRYPQHLRRFASAHAGVDKLFRPLASGLDRQLKFLWLDKALADEMANLLAHGDKYIARQLRECVVDVAHAALSASG